MAVYDDGHTYCFVCRTHTQGDGAAAPAQPKGKRYVDLIQGSAFTTALRAISPETFTHFRYEVGVKRNGERVHVANHFKDGMCIGQKLRTAAKDFEVVGKLDSLYGKWLWPSGGKRLVVTEGELDCLSVSQVLGNRWPVVSVPNGAPGALRACKSAIEYLSSFEEVVFMFDMDGPGQSAAKECAALLQPGKAKIAKTTAKDANKMLQDGLVKELVSAVWNAETYRPDGIIAMADLIERAKQPITLGAPWAWESLTQVTYGRRQGEVVFVGAGTGVGKTDLLSEQIVYDASVLGEKVGVIFLEQHVVETTQRLVGKEANKRFHVPDGSYTQDELCRALDSSKVVQNVFVYDNFGAAEWDILKSRIEYLVHELGCTKIYLDHLTALAAAEDDERVALEKITADMAATAKRLNVWMCVVSHLATPEKGSHEEGARVTIRQFKGSRAIGFWAHFMIGMERDQQNDDLSLRHVTTVRVLKDRYTGQATGFCFYVKYDATTGRLHECSGPYPTEPDDPGCDPGF